MKTLIFYLEPRRISHTLKSIVIIAGCLTDYGTDAGLVIISGCLTDYGTDAGLVLRLLF